jgi:molecular chaperone Hsp33
LEDYLVRIIARETNVRALACASTHLVHQACSRHGALPTACAALGRALSGGALMGALLKKGQRVALKFEGNGPLRKIIVEAESDGAVRGYVQVPEVHLPPRNGKLDVAGALGKAGLLTVVKDLGLKTPYTGVVQLQTGEIGDDLAHYLTESEQIPSAVGLGVFVEPGAGVTAAGGFLIQSFPPYDGEAVDRLIERIETMPPITQSLRDGRSPEDLLETIFSDVPFDTLEKRPLVFRCSCSRERVEGALVSLGREQLDSLIRDENGAEVNCEFCRERYLFTGEELKRILDEIH